MVWNGLIITAIPSWLALRDAQVNQIFWLLVGGGLIYVSRMMYITLVYATGAIPSEYFSVKKRPGYKEYQKQTNLFFPGVKKK